MPLIGRTVLAPADYRLDVFSARPGKSPRGDDPVMTRYELVNHVHRRSLHIEENSN
jgi:hypothetical protein